jgi:hypothetical protein
MPRKYTPETRNESGTVRDDERNETVTVSMF